MPWSRRGFWQVAVGARARTIEIEKLECLSFNLRISICVQYQLQRPSSSPGAVHLRRWRSPFGVRDDVLLRVRAERRRRAQGRRAPVVHRRHHRAGHARRRRTRTSRRQSGRFQKVYGAHSRCDERDPPTLGSCPSGGATRGPRGRRTRWPPKPRRRRCPCRALRSSRLEPRRDRPRAWGRRSRRWRSWRARVRSRTPRRGSRYPGSGRWIPGKEASRCQGKKVGKLEARRRSEGERTVGRPSSWTHSVSSSARSTRSYERGQSSRLRREGV